MLFEMLAAHILLCYIAYMFVVPSINNIQWRLKRIAFKSLVFSLCTAITITPPILSHGGNTNLIPYPLLATFVFHIYELPGSLVKYAFGFYLFPFSIWLLVSFSVGYFASVAKAQTGPPNYKKSDGSEWLQ